MTIIDGERGRSSGEIERGRRKKIYRKRDKDEE